MDATLHPLFYEKISPETATVVSMESIADVMLCGDFEEQFKNYQFVIIYGWRPFFDLLLKNTVFLDKVRLFKI